MTALSRQLRERRRQAGLSLAQAARRAGTSAPALSRYENGWDRFEMRTLRKLATALHCRLEVRLAPLPRSAARATESPGALVARLGRLFWDQRLTLRLLRAHPVWVLERVLEYGSLNDLAALRDCWGGDVLLARAAACRFSSARTRRFWALLLEREGVPCTRKFSREAVFDS